MNAIIIGANGYIGRHLSDYLCMGGSVHYNFDIQTNGLFGQNAYAQIDVRERSQFDQLPTNVEKIYFLSGLTGTGDSFSNYDSFAAVNLNGLMHLLDWMKTNACNARIIFPSTRLVYEGAQNALLDEDSTKTTKTVYAATKLAAEHILQAYGHAFNVSYTIFRICVPYGHWIGDHYSYGTIGFMLSQANMKKPITIYGDGMQKRTFTHIEDICNIMASIPISDATNQQIYNIGGEHMNLSEVADKIAKKYDVDVHYIPWPSLASRLESGDTMFDDNKLKSLGLGHYTKKLVDSI